MFTGIVEHCGEVVAVEDASGGRLLVIAAGPLTPGLEVGSSLAVNGACLTVVALAGDRATFQAVAETLARTNLGTVAPGHRVNLERALAAEGRFDGHIVQGHVDGVGRVRAVTPEGDSRRLWVDVDGGLLRYIASKGSVGVDGVSLTVSGVDGAGFEVTLIPHTLAVTVLGERRVGDLVNIEVDVLAKYVERLLETAR